MKKYHVVKTTNLDYLINEVNGFLKDGWELQGGICAVGGKSTGNGNAYYFQALYKIIK